MMTVEGKGVPAVLRLGQRSSWFASGGDLSGLLAPALMPVGV
jgi:hypothetical protein